MSRRINRLRIRNECIRAFFCWEDLNPVGFVASAPSEILQNGSRSNTPCGCVFKLPFFTLYVSSFVCRSHSTAGADQGTVTIQHSFEDSTAAHRNQGRQATSERDEEGEGVPCHLWLWTWDGSLDPKTGMNPVKRAMVKNFIWSNVEKHHWGLTVLTQIWYHTNYKTTLLFSRPVFWNRR